MRLLRVISCFNDQSSYFSEFIAKAEAEQQAMAIKSTFAAWNYESNITEETKEPYLKLQKDSSKLTKQHGKEAQNFNISVIEVLQFVVNMNLHIL